MTKMGQGQRFKPDWTEMVLEAFGWELAHSWSDLPCPAYSPLLMTDNLWGLLVSFNAFVLAPDVEHVCVGQ